MQHRQRTFAQPVRRRIALFLAATTLTSLSALAVVSAHASDATNLVGNGTFESGTQGWVVKSGSSLSTASGHSGCASAQVLNTSASAMTLVLNDQVNTVASTVKGTTYTATAWVRATTANTSMGIRQMEYNGSTLLGQKQATVWATDTAWHQVTVSYTAVSNGASIDLNLLAWSVPSGSGFGIDDVVMTTGAAVPPSATATDAVPGYQLVLDDQFATVNPSRWHEYDNSTFGAPTRVQRYMAANVVAGRSSAGSVDGCSLKLLSKRENVGGNSFTAGMLDSRSAGAYYPRYGRFEARMKIPHGQGLWPALWLTARNGGADMAEFDIMEYFHTQIPGKLSTTLHRKNNAGTTQYNVSKNYGGTFFEAPTFTPGWHTVSCDILPANGDPNSATTNVRFTCRLDGNQYWSYLDTSAQYWTTNMSSDPNAAWNIYIQGSQIDGKYVGSPDDPLGYSHELNQCISGGGTAPNGCNKTVGGYPILRAQFGDPASTFELDYVKVWKYTG